jgi:hypothetical protein
MGPTLRHTAVGDSEAGGQAPPEDEPRIRKIGEGLYQVGTVQVSADDRTIRCPGAVNMDEGGPIELLACTETGKVHESVFILHIMPMDLQLALILLNMEPGRNPAARYWQDDPDGRRPPGDAASITVEWGDEGSTGGDAQSADAGQLLYNVQTDTPLGKADWVFMGSMHYEDRFAAELDGTIITTFHDPVGILELNHETVNDDVYYVVNKQLCPEVGTAVELVIRPVQETEPEDAAEQGNH